MEPHFFQPILPGSSSAHLLPIPKAFQTDYLVDREDSEGVATLKSPLKSWKVKLNDFKFTDGWEEFFKVHELQSMSNILVFQYEGHDLIFQVWVFDLSLCEVEYSISPLMSEGEDENQMHYGHMGIEVEEDSEETQDDNDDATKYISKYPHFITTLKSYNIGRSFL
ncbi:hypothetical protein MKX01_008246, partial [Papaver californicum]